MSVDKTQDDSMDGNNIWDDSILIKNYDASIKLCKEEVAKRIAFSTNLELRSKEISDSSDSEENKAKQIEYNVGDFVRATFTDGIDYEATIVSIDKTYGKCVVKYIGYGNEECVNLNELVESWGELERERQELVKIADHSCVEECQSENSAEQQYSKSGTKKNKTKGKVYPQSVFTPPIPPMPPMFDCDNLDESDSLSAMLMSWYMSGYYTGLYHGQKMEHKSTQHKK